MTIKESGVTFAQATKALEQFANLFIRKDKMSEEKICNNCSHCSETKTWCNHYDYEVDYDHTCIDWEAITFEPVRMTSVELLLSIKNLTFDGLLDAVKYGFVIAGGQIIEEPKNLPCPVCGSEIWDSTQCVGAVYHPKVANCFLSNKTFDKEVWNDPSKRGKV